MELAQIISNQAHTTIQEQVGTLLDSVPTEQRLEHVVTMLQAASSHDEMVAEVAWETWNYAIQNNLWQDSYTTLEEFKQAVDYDNTLRAMLSKHELSQGRKVGHFMGSRMVG